MSLIEEALRRTQEKPRSPERPQAPPSHPPLQRHDAPLPATSQPSLSQPPQQAPARLGERLGLVLIGLVGLAFWMVRGRISRPVGSVARPIVQLQPAAHVTIPSQAVEHPPATAATPSAVQEPIRMAREPMGFQRPPPQLQLNGVIEGSGEPLALINGSLVRLGETIEGAILLEVKEGSARLRWLNQELVLRTTR